MRRTRCLYSMNDIYHTVTERFLRAQISFEPPAQPDYPDEAQGAPGNGPRGGPTRRFNAMGVLEDVMTDEDNAASNGGGESVLDIGPSEQPGTRKTTARQEPVITGAGRVRSLNAAQNAAGSGDWENVGRNDPCPCGSGKKFKKCHGVTA